MRKAIPHEGAEIKRPNYHPKEIAKYGLGSIARTKNWFLTRKRKNYKIFRRADIPQALTKRELVIVNLPAQFITPQTVSLISHPDLAKALERVAQETESAKLGQLTISSMMRPVEAQERLMEEGNRFAADPKNSDHCKGLAFDISTRGLNPNEKKRLKRIAKKLEREGEISFIDETLINNCLHISIP
ncbi:MAG: hypothetical protein COV47_02760 [Candidatus Diapherotrites archaeon CG11_big_fil_rev_8_21_14_0_20_37_9]|nr:MAG: hypothetical protein COV47_02760 [Candidatus Diapherotrites archaeon CG11_big_fil_rev_8_21_14_0_20_37_9]